VRCKLFFLEGLRQTDLSLFFAVPALMRGVQVLCEKPLTTDVAKCKAILAAVEETKGSVRGEGSFLSRSYLASCTRSTNTLSSWTVLFNYRYNPVYEKVFDVVRTSHPSAACPVV
jgi:hypothetical protein